MPQDRFLSAAMCVPFPDSHFEYGIYGLEVKVRERGKEAKRTKKASQGGNWVDGGKLRK